jgi:hypothetical protein
MTQKGLVCHERDPAEMRGFCFEATYLQPRNQNQYREGEA